MTQRTRTVSWDDPGITASWVGRTSGLEFLQRIIKERAAPPLARLLDFDLVEAEEGRAVFEVKPQEFHYNPTGTVHGGLAATVMDSALGCAVLSTLPAGVGYTTAELHVNLVRAILGDTPKLRADARVLHRGRTVRTAECKLTDASGKLYAHATTTCVVLSSPQA
ncbi:MAG TPA: PaaI family thioesterase [Candidatus Thermoplasmatota archaeon]|nr:PaaI family thioesterase [Candidatus Thermoplasmatota archaeon]